MTNYEYIRNFKWLPSNDDGLSPSNSDIRRWFDRKSVVINGETPGWREEVTTDTVTQLVFFPKGRRRTTII